MNKRASEEAWARELGVIAATLAQWRNELHLVALRHVTVLRKALDSVLAAPPLPASLSSAEPDGYVAT